MLSFEYLLPENEMASGRWQRCDQVVIVQAKGLLPSVTYDVMWLTDQMRPALILTENTDETGMLDCRFQTKDQEDGHILIAVHNRCSLRSPGISPEKCRALLWTVQKQSPEKNCCIDQSHICTTSDRPVIDCRNCEETKEKAEDFRICLRAEPPVDFLPERDWKHNMLKPYFETCTYAASVSMPTDVTPWRFIRTHASTKSGNNRYECVLGILFQNHVLRASVIIIREQEIGAGKTLPGFQYQKAPDGGGFWFKMTEY